MVRKRIIFIVTFLFAILFANKAYAVGTINLVQRYNEMFDSNGYLNEIQGPVKKDGKSYDFEIDTGFWDSGKQGIDYKWLGTLNALVTDLLSEELLTNGNVVNINATSKDIETVRGVFTDDASLAAMISNFKWTEENGYKKIAFPEYWKDYYVGDKWKNPSFSEMVQRMCRQFTPTKVKGVLVAYIQSTTGNYEEYGGERPEIVLKNKTGCTAAKMNEKIRKVAKVLVAARDYKSSSLEKVKTEDGSIICIKDNFNTKMEYNKSQIETYRGRYGKYIYNGTAEQNKQLQAKWNQVAGEDNTDEEIGEYLADSLDPNNWIVYDKEPKVDPDKDEVFQQPLRVADSGDTDPAEDAKEFENTPGAVNYVQDQALKDFSQSLYSILLGIGIVISVVVGVLLGIKIMLSPIGERVEAKKLLVPYVVGCVVVFGAFGIWKLVVTILQEL